MNSEPWNEFNLTQPPIVTIATKNSKIDLPALRKTLEKAIVCYESQTDLEESAAFCSRLLARRHNSFRNLKGYGELRKVNAALCRLLRLNIVAVLKTISGNLPAYIKIAGLDTQLPSRECFDYALLRLIALQKLYFRITACCLKSAAHFIKIINRNFYFDIITVFLSTIARIWKICGDNTKFTAQIYADLLKHRMKFPIRKQVLCEGFVFAKELDCGVDETLFAVTQCLTEFSEKNKTPTNDPSKDERVHTVSMIKSSAENVSYASLPSLPSQGKVDLGVAISRNTVKSSEQNLNDLKTLESILQFIKKESRKRQTMLAECRTKNISEKAWKVFKKKIAKLQTNDNRSAVKLMRSLLGNI